MQKRQGQRVKATIFCLMTAIDAITDAAYEYAYA
jgi:hypothetical protein